MFKIYDKLISQTKFEPSSSGWVFKRGHQWHTAFKSTYSFQARSSTSKFFDTREVIARFFTIHPLVLFPWYFLKVTFCLCIKLTFFSVILLCTDALTDVDVFKPHLIMETCSSSQALQNLPFWTPCHVGGSCLLLSIIIPESFVESRFGLQTSTAKFSLTFANKNKFDAIESPLLSPPKSFDRVTIFDTVVALSSYFTSSSRRFAKLSLWPIFYCVCS